MEAHFSLNDKEFEQQFRDCKFDPATFSHEAHLRLAWIHIQNYGTEKAVKNIREQLQNFVEHIGATGKYNDTLTVAAVMAVSHFIKRSGANNFAGFIQEFPRLKTNFRDLIQTHYSEDIFKLEVYKKEYVQPDLLAFS
ncbi:MAG TPA: hypothetical protein VF476_08730 [Chitinophagaceae bacterium]